MLSDCLTSIPKLEVGKNVHAAHCYSLFARTYNTNFKSICIKPQLFILLRKSLKLKQAIQQSNIAIFSLRSL